MKVLDSLSWDYVGVSSQSLINKIQILGAKSIATIYENSSFLERTFKEWPTYSELKERVSKIFQIIIGFSHKTLSLVNWTAQSARSGIIDLCRKISEISEKVFLTLGSMTGYILGPSISLVGAFIVRLALGKRTPTASPFYISVFMAATVLITVWAIQFFKHPKYQKILQNKGVAEALSKALPLPKSKILEPLHARSFIDFAKLNFMMVKPFALTSPKITEAEVRNSTVDFKQFCEWVKKKIKLDKANSDTLILLKNTLQKHLIKALRSHIIHGDKAMLIDLVSFISKDAYVQVALSKEEINSILGYWGARLSFLLKKTEFLELFPKNEVSENEVAVMDALLSNDTEKVTDITATGIVDPYCMIRYDSRGDKILELLGYEQYSLNLFQAAILSGNVEALKRIVASSSETPDWNQKDSKGRSMLLLACLSGSKPMWDFMKQFVVKRAQPEDIEYLYFLYASIKSASIEIFEDLYQPLLEDDYKDLTSALCFDLYLKAVSCDSKAITSYLEVQEVVISLKSNQASHIQMLKAAANGSNLELFRSLFDKCKGQVYGNASFMKELYEAVLVSENPSQEIIQDLRVFESTFKQGYQHLDLDVTAKDLVRSLGVMHEEQLMTIFQRISKDQLLRHMAENGEFFQKLIPLPVILEVILDRCTEAGYLLAACAKDAIKLSQLNTLRMLCTKGIDFIKKLPETSECLLSYSILSMNPELINIILSSTPPLPHTLIAALKARALELRYRKEDEANYATIVRMLDAKSLERGVVIAEDPQLHLALVKAGAMDLVQDRLSVVKEDVSRGLFASSLSYIGLMWE